ncbi:MAG: sulfatase-like hydrolase/transferase [Bdellovibrionales bacterium]|nr:sulfatase-like hydrolase/transferase [Bdellovibrionales bacterium]
MERKLAQYPPLGDLLELPATGCCRDGCVWIAFLKPFKVGDVVKKLSTGRGISRRDFIALSSAFAATSSLNGFTWAKSAREARKDKKPNILFIFTDQERYFSRLPSVFPFPGHERLVKMGTTFHLHQISATMCTSSRSTMLIGLQTPLTRMFDNTDAPYVKAMSTKIPTIGHMLRKVGYYTAYKGKWHLSRDFEDPACGLNQEKIMEGYGFSDFTSHGDTAAHTLGGYRNDSLTVASSVSWLRSKGRELQDAKIPWSLTVSLVNPHDIMYFNADAVGESIQDTGKLLMPAARAPQTKWYANDWKQPLPPNLRQPLDQVGRPSAHAEFDRAWGYCLGHIPLKDANWHRFTNFYLNSMRAVDSHLNTILNELDNLGLTENTVLVFTADHGEAGGHHGLRGKGPFAYRETLHVPFYIVHPDVKGGSDCRSLTSHIDIAPTLLSIAGVSKAETVNLAGRELPGKDIMAALTNPKMSALNTIRDKALFTYSAISTNDSEIVRIIAEAKAAGENPKRAVIRARYLPNLKKRGSLRTVFDGRYKFSRYFSPIQRSSPKSIGELFSNNDVELFDLMVDPNENTNLALDPNGNRALLEVMSAKLEAAIAAEIGKDDGREMPNLPGLDWSMDQFDL